MTAQLSKNQSVIIWLLCLCMSTLNQIKVKHLQEGFLLLLLRDGQEDYLCLIL